MVKTSVHNTTAAVRLTRVEKNRVSAERSRQRRLSRIAQLSAELCERERDCERMCAALHARTDQGCDLDVFALAAMPCALSPSPSLSSSLSLSLSDEEASSASSRALCERVVLCEATPSLPLSLVNWMSEEPAVF